MTKQAFLNGLRRRLSGLPQSDIDDRVNFYSEMIDDRIEEGRSEEEAVSDIGPIKDVISEILKNISFGKIAKERIRPKRRLLVWEIILLVLASPILIALAASAFAVIISLYAVIWALDVALWAVFASCAIASPGCLFLGIASLFGGNAAGGILYVSTALVAAGVAILLYFGCIGASKGIIILTKKIALGTKKLFMKKEKKYE